jgi:4-hydroxy-tetrahydrodipicolinate synthase
MTFPSHIRLWTACVTPFDQTGDTIDFQSLEKLLTKQESVGAGVVLLGTTGEAWSLNRVEKEAIVAFAVEHTHAPLLIGVPSHSIEEAAQWIRICDAYPIAGFLLTPPAYVKAEQYGQIAWFSHLLECSQKPFILYNNPSRIGVALSDAVLGVVSHTYGHCVGLKDSGGCLLQFEKYRNAASNLLYFCGEDTCLDSYGPMIHGGICVASNAWPEVVLYYIQHPMQWVHEPCLMHAIRALSKAVNPLSIKQLLHHRGDLPWPTVRLPLSLLDGSDLASILEADRLVDRWQIP